ncbi:unnamed protein product [Closterium sp. NIES-54]
MFVYLGLQITRDRAQRTITLTQSQMVQQVLQRFGFLYSSPQSTPLPTGHSLSAPPLDESVEPSGLYPELVGYLMYLMTCTRPSLAYPLSILARYVAPGRHRPEHWAAAKRVLRYLWSTSGIGLVLGGRGRVSCRPALPLAPPCWLSRHPALLAVASPCPVSRVAVLVVVSPCCPRAALLAAAPPCPACVLPCPARAEPPYCLHHPAVRRPAARAAQLLPALLHAALLADALLPARRPAGSSTAARTALPATPCYAPPFWLAPCCPGAALLAAALLIAPPYPRRPSAACPAVRRPNGHRTTGRRPALFWLRTTLP